MPLIIVVLVGALGTFYFKTDPDRLAKKAELAALEKEALEAAATTGGALALIGSAGAIEGATGPALIARPIEEDLIPLPGEPPLIAANSSEEEFTSWMSPLALDTYIRQKNGSHDQSFWQRGHWMSAVEGRWQESGHEFRIVFSKMPTNGKWRWQYRANQTLEAFIRSHEELGRQGYTMIQSQAFERPDGTRRYQGVWHQREDDAPAMVGRPRTNPPVSSVPTAAITTPAQAPAARAPLGGLDVNRLNFR